MRRALRPSLALAIAAALAACSVDVEGARCSLVGSTTECPSGQRCGTGLTCSVRAASCEPCVVGATSCRAGVTCSVVECTADGDAACGTWKVAGPGAVSLQTCQIPLGGVTQECACLSHVVDPAGGTCKYASIASAIAAATRFDAPKVVLGGAAFTYGNAIDDAAPIVIPAGVTLTGDDAATAAATNRLIAVQGPGPEGLRVQAGASVRGVAVQRGVSASNELTIGVLLAGGAAAGGNTLVSVRVDAGGAGGGFATGLRVAGANAVAVSDVLVQGATVAGLEVNRLGAGDVVLVDQSVFDGNQVGVSLLRGDLTLSGSSVKRSAWEGVVAATGTPGQTSLALVDDVIAWNGRGGVRLSVNDALNFTGTRICGNTGYDRTFSGITRTVGGLYVSGNPPASALGFTGNLIHGNEGDQVYVGAASSPWELSGAPACTASSRNVFAGYTAPGVGVAAVGASVAARFNSWGETFPLAGTDFYYPPASPGGSVDAGTGSGATDFCAVALPADLNCPAP